MLDKEKVLKYFESKAIPPYRGMIRVHYDQMYVFLLDEDEKASMFSINSIESEQGLWRLQDIGIAVGKACPSFLPFDDLHLVWEGKQEQCESRIFSRLLYTTRQELGFFYGNIVECRMTFEEQMPGLKGKQSLSTLVIDIIVGFEKKGSLSETPYSYNTFRIALNALEWY